MNSQTRYRRTLVGHLRWAMCALAVGLVAACEPAEDDKGPQWVRVFTQDESGVYGLYNRELKTLESARRVKGAALKMRGGGSVFIEAGVLDGSLTAESEEDVEDVDLIKGSTGVWAEYFKENGVLVPADWDSLVMFSFYHNIERARAFFGDLGVPSDALRVTRCFYKVNFSSVLVFGRPLVTDNAAYAPTADAFLLFPRHLTNGDVPMALNLGISAHEFSHAVMHRLVNGSSRVPITTEDWSALAANTYASVDEGLADFFAAHLTGDPNFIDVSIQDTFGLERDISKEKMLDELNSRAGDHSFGYDPYPLGTAIASFLWAITPDGEKRDRVAKAILTTLIDLRKSLGPDFDLIDFLQPLLENLEDELQAPACTLLEQRLGELFSEVATCGSI